MKGRIQATKAKIVRVDGERIITKSLPDKGNHMDEQSASR
jgi:hypothetical protein